MRKIANAKDLEAELSQLLEYASSKRPSRAVLAFELRELSARVAAGGDPRWILARYPGKAKDGTAFKKGEMVLYYPNTKSFLAGRAAEEAWRRFESEVADEAVYNGTY